MWKDVMRWAGLVAGMGEKKNESNILMGTPERSKTTWKKGK
jgi:hypothetical protein